MRNHAVETILGAIVIVVALMFLFFAYTTTHDTSVGTYDVVALMNTAEGVASGTDVRLHGIRIGQVTSVDMDLRTYKPVAHLAIRDDVHLPVDSRAWMASAGVNGGSFLTVQPGRSARMLAEGETWKAN